MTVASLTRILAKISLQAELQLQGYLCVICKARFRTGRYVEQIVADCFNETCTDFTSLKFSFTLVCKYCLKIYSF